MFRLPGNYTISSSEVKSGRTTMKSKYENHASFWAHQ